MLNQRYRIGDFTFQLMVPDNFIVPENMKKFQIDSFDGKDKSIDIIYEFSITDDLDAEIEALERQRDSDIEVNRRDFRLIYIDGKECRFLGIKGRPEFYGISRIKEDGKVEVMIRSSYQDWTTHDTIFISFLMLEKFMAERDAYILHSSYIQVNGKAILFSAPSETGKSTQASLWEKYKGAKVVNGDRSLIHKKGDSWYVSGWPVCGDSGICYNESYPLEVVVMLKQAPENKVYPLRPMQAFQELLTQITINGWNRDFQEKAMNMVEGLITEVPVLRQECDISEGAVKTLDCALNVM